MSRPRQLQFFTPQSHRKLQEHSRRLEHGGGLRVGKRKLARPFDPKKPMHITMRSSRAHGDWSMLRSRKETVIRTLVHQVAQKNGVRVYQFANSGNHLHLLLGSRSKSSFQRFLRTIGALIARIVTGAKKGNPVGKFWDDLAWSRVVNSQADFVRVRDYVELNEMEGQGVWRREWNAKSRVIRP